MNTMHPNAGGWAGILAGAGLIVEAALWTASGWTPQTFTDAETALGFLRDSGDTLRLAVFAGFVNLAFAAVFFVGLADRLRASAPTRAAVTLWLGMIGVASHLLVPMAHWYGVPAFRDATPAEALGSWTGFAATVSAAGGAGSLFLGLSMTAAGSALVTQKALPAAPVVLGWFALIGGIATVLTLFAPDTPLSGVAAAVYMPSLLLAIVFRVWAGLAMTRIRHSVESPVSSAMPTDR